MWLARASIEGSRRFAIGEDGNAATLTPSLEFGLRIDGGDAEEGFGAELSGGLAFENPDRGLFLDLKMHGLVLHKATGFQEWGASASLGIDPSTGSERGLSLSLRLNWGSPPAGAMDALLNRETMASVTANDNVSEFGDGGRLDGELGYGLPAFGGAFTGIPNLGFALSDSGTREWRIGWRLISAVRGDPGIEVSLDATHREAANDDAPGHGVMLRALIRW